MSINIKEKSPKTAILAWINIVIHEGRIYLSVRGCYYRFNLSIILFSDASDASALDCSIDESGIIVDEMARREEKELKTRRNAAKKELQLKILQIEDEAGRREAETEKVREGWRRKSQCRSLVPSVGRPLFPPWKHASIFF